ncbi:TonB-dependent receptor [Olivibacter sp. CPCC 100613]|uniref:TonB-dependent receptor n=1 Tax=Olivibacter sp. CPCC 100613 TaxID=3079931 RepID=UPI002FF72AD4
MKLSLILTMLTIVKAAAVSYGQQITIKQKNISVEETLKVIRKQIGYNILYSPQIVNKGHRFDIDRQNAPLQDVLDEVFEGQPFLYTINGKTIVIKDKLPFTESEGSVQQLIEGQVVDEQGAPLAGVTVILKNSNIVTQTDATGIFRLQVAGQDAITLIVRSLGYLTQELRVSNTEKLKIALKEEQTSLDQVVVIGYGTQKKSDITGSVSSIRSADFNKGTNTTFDQLISGKASGVQVIQNSAEPGGGVSVRIRGASSINAGSSPLYVIDGLPIDNAPVVTGGGANFDAPRVPRNPLAALNPADIESIEILKDASATAIYGARGANGVVIVTTKKGKDGSTQVSYNASGGIQQVAHKIDLLSADEYKTVLNGLVDAGGGAETYRIGDDITMTDWQDEVFRKALIQNHSLSLSGGNNKTKFYTSFNYFDQQGVVRSSGFKRYSAKLNLSTAVTDKLETGVSLNVSYTRDDYAPGGFGINAESGAIYATLNFDPTLPIRDANGIYTLSPFLDMDNPLALLEGANALANTYRTFGTAYAKYQLLPGLSAKVNLGGDFSSQKRDVYVSRITRVGGPLGGSASILQGTLSNYLIEGTLNYDKQWDNHAISAVLGATTQRFIIDNTNQNARNFPSDLTGTYNTGLGDQSTYRLGSERRTNRLQSYLGRINYTFKDKYLLTGSFRMDGSSRFGVNNKFGYFPSFALGWKLHQEAFMQNAKAISNLKPRLSWGQTGNQEIGDYAAITTFSTGPGAILDDQLISTTQPARIANPDLKWETTEQFNLGLDFGLFNERIAGTIDYFQKKTFNMLLNLPIPTTTGFTSILSNVGSIRNTGWDFGITTQNLIGDFTWTTSINLSTLRNKVVNLGGIDQIITGDAGQTNQVFMIKEGLPVYSFYGYQIDGVWQTDDDFSVTRDPVAPGDIKYRDMNGDGVVNAEDRTILGNSFPKLTWSFGNNFSYKNWQLSVFLEGVQGVSMLNNNLVDAYFPVQFRRNRFAEPYLNRWTPENPSNKYPSFVNPTGQGSKLVNSYTVEDASYLRVRTLTLAYNLPLNKKYLRNLGLSLTAENLLTITDYSGFDPAVNPNGGAFNRIDFNAYPVAKTFILGLSVDF